MRGAVALALAGLGALSALAAGCPGAPSCPESSVRAGGRCVVEADASMGEDAPGGDACALRSFFPDGDLDGFGAGEPVEACEPPAGTVERGGDCDDENGAVHPGADETCDGVDEDCDGEPDEGLAPPLGTPRMLDADPSLGIGSASVAVFGAGYAVGYAVGGKVYVAGVAEDGSTASAPVAVDSDGDTQEKPALAATAEGGLVVVWQRPVGGGAALVRARRLDASFGGPAAQTVTSSAADTGGAGPAVASVDGLVVVAWARADRAGFDGQVLREADLSPTGAAVSLMDARLDLGPPAALALIPVAEPRPPHVLMAVAAPAASASSRPARVARLRVRPLATDGAAAILDDGPATGRSAPRPTGARARSSRCRSAEPRRRSCASRRARSGGASACPPRRASRCPPRRRRGRPRRASCRTERSTRSSRRGSATGSGGRGSRAARRSWPSRSARARRCRWCRWRGAAPRARSRRRRPRRARCGSIRWGACGERPVRCPGRPAVPSSAAAAAGGARAGETMGRRMSTARCVGSWVVLIAWAAALPASAQEWTVLPVERDARVPEEERRAAGDAVRESGALGPSNAPVSAEALAERAGELASCTEVDCAARLAARAGLDLAVVVAVWPGSGEADRTVAVSLVEPNGLVYEADRPAGGDLRAAAVAAFVEATNELRRGGGVELRVRSVPEGALVRVDGVEVGVTPHRGSYPPGTVEVEVSLRGERERREVALESEPVAIDVELDVAGAPEEPPVGGDGGGGRSLADWLVGGGLALGGAALVVVESIALARSGEIVDREGRGERRTFETIDTIALAAGIALVVTGGVVLWTAPFAADVGPEHAGLVWSGTF